VIFVLVVKELRALAMSAPSLLRIANWKGWMSVSEETRFGMD
jgi:hypothetical protein